MDKNKFAKKPPMGWNSYDYYDTTVTDDFWDDFSLLKNMFYRCELWQNHVSEGCYPDCDMLPMGMVGKGFGDERQTRFTFSEQRTMISLWCIFGSPLMLGCEMTLLDEKTLGLLTNENILDLLDPKRIRKQIYRSDDQAIWQSRGEKETVWGFFNLSDEKALLSDFELRTMSKTLYTNLWTGDTFDEIESLEIEPHDCLIIEERKR